jgi:hypothetical protein
MFIHLVQEVWVGGEKQYYQAGKVLLTTGAK